MFGRRKIATLVAELIGTGALTLLVLSVQRSTIGVPFFIAMAAGLTVLLMSLYFVGISGAYFNPALVIGMWTARKISTINGILFIAVQFLGAWGAYYLYTYYVNSSLQNIGGKYNTRILVAEAVGTAIFAFSVMAAKSQKFNNGLVAVAAGLGLMIGIISASSVSLGLLNPAVALGVKAWVLGTYVLGPIIGAVVGVNLYGMLFAEKADGLISPSGLAALTSPFGSTTNTTSKSTSSSTRKTTSKKKK